MKLDFSFQKIEPNKSQQLQAEAGTANQEVDNNSIKRYNLTIKMRDVIIMYQRSPKTKN
jgi:hypothetical protein